MMGYGGTDAPESLSFYTFKRAADDIATLAHILGAPQIHIGGHDWGGAIVYRTAMWHPTLILSVFSICTPMFPATTDYITLPDLVETQLPNFRYQLHLSGPEVEATITKPPQIRNFLAGMYGAHGPDGERAFDVRKGILFDNLDKIIPSTGKLLNEEELQFYTDEYSRKGLRGPLNWYRTRKLNFDDELEAGWAEKGTGLVCPTLFVQATNDAALPPAMSEGIERYFGEGLLWRREVASHHWCLWAATEEVNRLIKEFVEVQVGERAEKSSL